MLELLIRVCGGRFARVRVDRDSIAGDSSETLQNRQGAKKYKGVFQGITGRKEKVQFQMRRDRSNPFFTKRDASVSQARYPGEVLAQIMCRLDTCNPGSDICVSTKEGLHMDQDQVTPRAQAVMPVETTRPVVDLPVLAARLEQELPSAGRGYRHETISHTGTIHLILFVFEAEGNLPEHKAAGTITLHVLSGILDVQAEGQRYELCAHQIVALPPGVRHSVQAREASRMLLTVCTGGS